MARKQLGYRRRPCCSRDAFVKGRRGCSYRRDGNGSFACWAISWINSFSVIACLDDSSIQHHRSD
ncbi:2875_t:CDS:2 [Diversispora eburnea]|uniref:2875_t:CDS:1 n=1 Tax=Diversispora eburnea TaxID=1213867 RepID=A0A9N9BQ83_9GLOM|nr:2875_t:CDS:2 [Diversispora eburnea]